MWKPKGIRDLPTGFVGDQGLERQAAEDQTDGRAELHVSSIYVDSGGAQCEPGEQRQHRVAGEREGQAFVHASLFCHAGDYR